MIVTMNQVVAFHHVTSMPVLDKPQFPSASRLLMRLGLVQEECQELLEAVRDRDMVETADALADIIYVCVGMALELGIPLDAVWREVHASNMRKAVLQPDGSRKCVFRADGKLIKPEGWVGPDVAGVLERAR